MTIRVNIFEDRDAQAFFAEVIEAMNPLQKAWFVKAVKNLFDDKCVSEEGEFDTFKITKQDLMQLADCVVHSAKA